MTPSAPYHDGHAVAMRGDDCMFNPHCPIAIQVSYAECSKGYAAATYALRGGQIKPPETLASWPKLIWGE